MCQRCPNGVLDERLFLLNTFAVIHVPATMEMCFSSPTFNETKVDLYLSLLIPDFICIFFFRVCNCETISVFSRFNKPNIVLFPQGAQTHIAFSVNSKEICS